MAAKDLLHSWLRDAHSMEKALADFSEKALKDFDDAPEYQQFIQTSIDKGQEHRDAAAALLENTDAGTSTGKDLMAKLTSMVSGMGSSMFTDDKTKNFLVLHGALHFAHACYASLAHGARTCGEEQIASTAERIAGEKEQMAKKVMEHVPAVTDMALSKEADD